MEMLVKYRMIVFFFLAITAISCQKRNNDEIEACLYGVHDNYFKDLNLLKITGRYPRKITLYFKIFHHKESTVYVPIQSQFDTIFCSKIILNYNGRTLNTRNNRTIKDCIINHRDTMFVKLTIPDNELERIGYSDAINLEYFISNLEFKYFICRSDTLHSKLKINNILITKKKDLFYEYRDEDTLWEQE